MSEAAASKPAQRSGFGEAALRLRVGGAVGFLIALAIVFTALRPQFLSLQNLSVVAMNASVLAIVAAAQGVVLLTRNLDVSVGAMMGCAAYLTADYAAHHQGAGPLPLFALTVGIGTALGLVNGLIVAYGEVSPLIATLGTMSLYRGLTYMYAHGQEVSASRMPPWMAGMADLRVAGVPFFVIVAALTVAAIAFFLRAFPFGRRIYAVGSNPAASVFYGLRTERVVLFAFAFSGFISGFAGLLYAARVGTVTVVLGSGWELTSLAAAVLGGVSVTGGSGSIVGAALGGLILAAIDNGLVLLGIPEFWRMFVQGVAIVLAVSVDVAIATQVRRTLGARRRRA